MVARWRFGGGFSAGRALLAALSLTSTLTACGSANGPIEVDGYPPSSPPLFGAIRWDAWLKGNEALGWVAPSIYGRYKHREPFYGWYLAGLDEEEAEQEIVEQEIAYAADSGVDYWAYVWYADEGEPQAQIQEPFKHYMASPNHDRVKFTVVLQAEWLAWPDLSWSRYEEAYLPYLTGLFADPQYVTVDGGRPVVMLFHSNKLPQERLDQLRNATVDAGLPAPYFVNVNQNLDSTHSLGLDAVTSYGSSGAYPVDNTHCWASQVAADERNWGPRPGVDTVVGLTPMADPRPRREPPFWVDQPTRMDWRKHLSNAFTWIDEHPKSVTDPPLLLTYSWNELDEGGPGIVPTLQEGTRYLDDLKAVRSGDTSGYVDVLNGSHCDLAKDEGWQNDFPMAGITGNRDSDEEIASQEGSLLHLATEGQGFEWLGTLGPDRGQAEVRVDDGDWEVIDLYSPEVARHALIHSVSDLSPGEHDYQIRVLGSKQDDSSDVIVGVDEIRVQR